MRVRVFAIVAALLLCVSLGSTATASTHNIGTAVIASAHSMPMFDSEDAAQAHCPSDEVVWLNLPTGIYHEKGMRWYGRTKHGAYVCRREADAAGYRDTRNGQ